MGGGLSLLRSHNPPPHLCPPGIFTSEYMPERHFTSYRCEVEICKCVTHARTCRPSSARSEVARYENDILSLLLKCTYFEKLWACILVREPCERGCRAHVHFVHRHTYTVKLTVHFECLIKALLIGLNFQ